MKEQEEFHFFAASPLEWRTTTEKIDLRKLIKAMDKAGRSYNLFRVPGKFDQNYEINWYQPQVEGTVWLGYYEVNKAKA